MSWKSLCVILLGLFALAVSIDVAQAGEKEIVVRMASHMSSRDASGMALERLGDLLNTRSKGRLKATVANDGKLGNQRQVVELIRDGALEATISLAGGPGHYAPEVTLVELPYIYKDDAHMVRVLKGVRPYVEEILAPFNLKPFGYMNIGFRFMLNKKRPIVRVADLKGLKMRGPVPLYIDMFNALGASGTMVTWTEVYTALQTGVVDGMEASPSLIYAMKFHEQAKFLSKTYHIGANFYIVTGKKWFEQLPKDLQQVFVDAVEEVSKYQVDLQAKLDREDMDKLIKEGVKVNEVESLEEFQKAVIPWRDKYVKDKGPKFETFYQKMLAVK